jgi:large subunit ribosomal protein L18
MARFDRGAERLKRHRRIRKRIRGTSDRPRLCVTKTLRHVYAQVIDDETGRTLTQASTLEPEIRGDVSGPNVAAAEKLGTVLAERASKSGVEAVVFDRGGHPYHGVISSFAEACRKGGLRF